MIKQAAVFCLITGLVPFAGAADVDFGSVDASVIAAQVESGDIDVPAVKAPVSSYFTLDCRRVTFGPSDNEMETKILNLSSTEWVKDCHYVPDPPANPQPGNHQGNNPPANNNHNNQPPVNNHPNNPGIQPGHNNPPPPHKSLKDSIKYEKIDIANPEAETPRGMQCSDRPGSVHRGNARIIIQRRDLLPWEEDVAEVCMQDDNIWLTMKNSSYNYSVGKQGFSDVTFTLAPQGKIKTDPDENGLAITGFSYNNGAFSMKVRDAWAKEYAGEQVAVKVELKKSRFLVDKTIGTKTFVFNAADVYDIDFTNEEMEAGGTETVGADETADNVRGTSKYYVKWGFTRLGNISTGKYIDKGNSDKIAI